MLLKVKRDVFSTCMVHWIRWLLKLIYPWFSSDAVKTNRIMSLFKEHHPLPADSG